MCLHINIKKLFSQRLVFSLLTRQGTKFVVLFFPSNITDNKQDLATTSQELNLSTLTIFYNITELVTFTV